MLVSPKYKVLYETASLLSVYKNFNGSLVTQVLLDDSDHTIETIAYYGHTKKEVLNLTKEKYNIKEEGRKWTINIYQH